VAQVAVSSQINIKHIDTVWADRTVVQWCHIIFFFYTNS